MLENYVSRLNSTTKTKSVWDIRKITQSYNLPFTIEELNEPLKGNSISNHAEKWKVVTLTSWIFLKNLTSGRYH